MAFRYRVLVPVPFYETREVTIEFRGSSFTPRVWADGPRASPHRFRDGSLCMWFVDDPESQKWRFDHGLLDLLDTIKAHLFREAWWRETGGHGDDGGRQGEWLGPEVGHTGPSEPGPNWDSASRAEGSS